MFTVDDDRFYEAMRVAFARSYGTGPTSGRFKAIWLNPDSAAELTGIVLREVALPSSNSEETMTEGQS